LETVHQGKVVIDLVVVIGVTDMEVVTEVIDMVEVVVTGLETVHQGMAVIDLVLLSVLVLTLTGQKHKQMDPRMISHPLEERKQHLTEMNLNRQVMNPFPPSLRLIPLEEHVNEMKY